MHTLLQQIIDNPLASSIVIVNLILIESLLSIDNAAVLAIMVMDLPKEQRNKALKYGIFGAYIFRGLCLLFVTFLIRIWWLKPIGGLYLLYLSFDYFKTKNTKSPKDDLLNKEENWLYKNTIGIFGKFVATIILVELMDLAFSIDNVFAAVAFSENIILICIGVFIGILAMRFVAQYFVKLIEKYPFLETSAFIVIGVLGIKLLLSLYEHFYPETYFSEFLSSHFADWATSVVTVSIFIFPIISSTLFNYPKQNK